MNDKKKILFWGGKSKAKILNNMLNRQGEELSYIYDKFINKLDFFWLKSGLNLTITVLVFGFSFGTIDRNKDFKILAGSLRSI